MKRIAQITFLLMFLLPLFACTPTTTTSQPTAPGYRNSADQQMGEILAGAHAFYTSIQQQSQAGTLVLSPEVKLAMNDFGVSLNSADAVYLAYHAGTATQAVAQLAVYEVQSKQAALPLPGASK
jgi:hypothetical protein